MRKCNPKITLPLTSDKSAYSFPLPGRPVDDWEADLGLYGKVYVPWVCKPASLLRCRTPNTCYYSPPAVCPFGTLSFVPQEIFSLCTLPLAISAWQSPYRPGQICHRYHIGAGHLMSLENLFNVNTMYLSFFWCIILLLLLESNRVCELWTCIQCIQTYFQ